MRNISRFARQNPQLFRNVSGRKVAFNPKIPIKPKFSVSRTKDCLCCLFLAVSCELCGFALKKITQRRQGRKEKNKEKPSNSESGLNRRKHPTRFTRMLAYQLRRYKVERPIRPPLNIRQTIVMLALKKPSQCPAMKKRRFIPCSGLKSFVFRPPGRGPFWRSGFYVLSGC